MLKFEREIQFEWKGSGPEPITVAELIKKLKRFNQEAKVFTPGLSQVVGVSADEECPDCIVYIQDFAS